MTTSKTLLCRSLALLAFTLSLAPSTLASGTTSDWPQYLGVDRNGVSSESTWFENWPRGGPQTAWKQKIGIGYSAVSVADGRAYTTGHAGGQDTVFCFDAVSGEQIWSHSYECILLAKYYKGGTATSPTIHDGLVYTISKEGHFHCYDAANGKVRWMKELQKDLGVKMPEWGFAGSPLVYKDLLILDVGVIVAFRQGSGKLVWKTEDFGPAYASPVLFTLNGKEYFATLPKFGLVIVEASNGKVLGKQRWKTKYDVNAATPIVVGNRVFVSSGYQTGGAVYEVSEDGIREIWRNKVMRNHFSPCVYRDGYLYGFDEKELKCIDFNTGEEKWGQKGLGKGSLMMADGKLIVLSEKGELVIAEATPEEFKALKRTQAIGGHCWTGPVLSHSRIYCRNDTVDLVCLDLSRK